MQAIPVAAATTGVEEVEDVARAYETEAEGDSATALRFAVADALALEAALRKTRRAVSHGYVRGDFDGGTA